MEDCTNKKIGQFIASYELGLLDEKDQARFEDHALECPHCRRELERLYPKYNILLENRNEILNNLESKGVDVSETESEAAVYAPLERKISTIFDGIKRRKVLVPAFSLAAVLILALILIRKPTPENPYLDYLSFEKAAYVSLEEGRVTQSEAEDFFNEGMRYYVTDEFKGAITNLQKAAELDSSKSKAWLYLGISFYLDHQPVAAIKALQRAKEIADPVQENWATWYMAQAYILLRNPAQSIPLLKTLSDQKLEYSIEADRLLRKIQKISPELFDP